MAVVALAVAVLVAGVRQRLRFAAGLGALGLVGLAATVVAADRVVGPIYGYLVVWAVAIPVAVLIGVGMLAGRGPGWRAGRPVSTTSPAVRAWPSARWRWRWQPS